MYFLKVYGCVLRGARLISTTVGTPCSWKDVYEPDYLASYEPDIPELPPLNIQMKAYDFAVLENFHKHVNRLADTLDIDVETSWATPPQMTKVQKFRENSAIVEHDYTLNLYERNLQIINTPSTRHAMLLRLLQETLPEGVSVQVLESAPEHQEIRYVPDMELLNLKQQLQDISGGFVKKKKK